LPGHAEGNPGRIAKTEQLRVVVFGATGNVGTALVKKLVSEPRVESVVGVSRRLPSGELLQLDPKVTWDVADIACDNLDMVRDADVVVHLAWQIQPSRDEPVMRRTNVDGSRRVFDAVVGHGVPALVYASSVGTYAQGPKDTRTDESWSTSGVPSSTYSRHKATVESMLDVFEKQHPSIRLVRMRTSLVFQRSAASEIHRLFLGRLLPWHLPQVLRVVPQADRLVFQATHADDIADAYVQAIVREVSGPFNIAAEPVLDSAVIAQAVGGRTLPVPPPVLRFAADAAYRLRLQPSEPGWLDMALQTPVMDTSRAREVLQWSPTHSSIEALLELFDGIGAGAGGNTAPLHARDTSKSLSTRLEGIRAGYERLMGERRQPDSGGRTGAPHSASTTTASSGGQSTSAADKSDSMQRADVTNGESQQSGGSR